MYDTLPRPKIQGRVSRHGKCYRRTPGRHPNPSRTHTRLHPTDDFEQQPHKEGHRGSDRHDRKRAQEHDEQEPSYLLEAVHQATHHRTSVSRDPVY